MIFKTKAKRKIAEIEYNVKKLTEKYIDLNKRIRVIEREKAAEKTTASKNYFDKTH